MFSSVKLRTSERKVFATALLKSFSGVKSQRHKLTSLDHCRVSATKLTGMDTFACVEAIVALAVEDYFPARKPLVAPAPRKRR
jgi:hypothetical protein